MTTKKKPSSPPPPPWQRQTQTLLLTSSWGRRKKIVPEPLKDERRHARLVAVRLAPPCAPLTLGPITSTVDTNTSRDREIKNRTRRDQRGRRLKEEEGDEEVAEEEDERTKR